MFKHIIKLSAVAAFAFAFVVAPVASAASVSNKGFDEFGYNNKARVFVGTCASWAKAGGHNVEANCGAYAVDKLVMKWNKAWDDCNDNGYNDPDYCAGAWTTNAWLGNADGSGETYFYKMIWVGSEGMASDLWQDGGYLIWGNYEVIMEHGSTADGHDIYTMAKTPGLGHKH